MRKLKPYEREFFEGLLRYSSRLHRGYYYFAPNNLKYGKKKYKRSRVLMQLHVGCLLEKWEIVHHKDGNSKNDALENLEIQLTGNHTSIHQASSKKIVKFSPHNKLKSEIVCEIKNLSKTILHKNGKPNCSKIGDMLGIAGFTVSKYIKGSGKKNCLASQDV